MTSDHSSKYLTAIMIVTRKSVALLYFENDPTIATGT